MKTHWQTIRTAILAAVMAAAVTQHAAAETSSPSRAFASFERTLSVSEAREALASFSSADRKRWRLTPGFRGGLMLSRMDKATREAAFMLLGSVLSADGTKLIAAVREREAVLGRMTGNTSYRDPEKYYLAVFGKPTDRRWGLRFEGHHLSLNVTLEKDRIVSVLPLAIGSNPERLPRSGATLLSPIFDRAGVAHRDKRTETVRAMLDGMLAPFPADPVGSLAKRLTAAFVAGNSKASDGEYTFSGAGASIALIKVTGNHLHLTLSDPRVNFSGL